MSNLALVIDEDCGPCSRLGRSVTDGTDLTILSRSHPDFEVVSKLSGGRLPCLVEYVDGRPTRAWTGWAMRARVARHLGLGKFPLWLSLYVSEVEARKERADERGVQLSRRTLITAAAATAFSGVVAAQPAFATTRQVKLSPQELASAARMHPHLVKEHGPLLDGVRTTDHAGNTNVIMRHGSGAVSTQVGGLPGVIVTNTVLSKTSIDSKVTTPEGVVHLRHDRRSNGTTESTLLSPQAAAEQATSDTPHSVAPAWITPIKLYRFGDCLRACGVGDISWDCLENCATNPGGAYCAVCVGITGVTCVRQCAHILN